MLNFIPKVLANRPLLAIEHILYTLLVVSGIWGLLPDNTSITVGRLINQFGVIVVVCQYASFIVVGAIGYLSLITARIEHRIKSSLLAFLVFAFSAVANLGVFVFGGPFNPISLMLAVTCSLISGVVYLHLKMHQRLGCRGRRGETQ